MSRGKVVWIAGLLAGAMSLPAAAQSASIQSAGLQNRSGAVVSGGLPPAPQKKVAEEKKPVLPFSRLAVSINASTLGIGGQIATPLMRTLNLRGGATFVNFGAGAGIDGANYESQIHLKDGQVSLDWFPFGRGPHISPGVVIFQSALSASMYVPAGGAFSLGNTNFTSGVTDPITGSARIVFGRSIMPALTIGFGNMIAREGRHWSVPFEVGAAYTGHYTLQMNLKGTACVNGSCLSTSSTLVQQSLLQEEGSLNEPMKHYQLYPIVTTGVSYRF
jgi:hypothetical protein